MGSTTLQQVFRIVLLALATATLCRAQQPAAPVAAPSDAVEPAAEANVAADAPVLPPKVVCTGDQMTISANNSTLSSVLDEVHRCMGTKIDLPDGAGGKRMFDRLGPGPNTQILDEFLSATGYNYIIGSSPANVEKIDSIMLLARVADSTTTTANLADGRPMTANRRAFLQMHQAAIPHPMTDADLAAAAAVGTSDQTPAPAPTPAPTPAPADAGAAPAAATPAVAAPAAAPADPTTAQPSDAAPASQPEVPPTTPPPANTSPARPNSTADQINNMQQMFELRKQMNQQQNQNTTPPPQ